MSLSLADISLLDRLGYDQFAIAAMSQVEEQAILRAARGDDSDPDGPKTQKNIWGLGEAKP